MVKSDAVTEALELLLAAGQDGLELLRGEGNRLDQAERDIVILTGRINKLMALNDQVIAAGQARDLDIMELRRELTSLQGDKVTSDVVRRDIDHMAKGNQDEPSKRRSGDPDGGSDDDGGTDQSHRNDANGPGGAGRGERGDLVQTEVRAEPPAGTAGR